MNCHCGQPATHQHQRDATPDEHAAYIDNMQAWRASRNLPPLPDDCPAFAHPATAADYRCCTHAENCTCPEVAHDA